MTFHVVTQQPVLNVVLITVPLSPCMNLVQERTPYPLPVVILHPEEAW
jgi:hypothetical protein